MLKYVFCQTPIRASVKDSAKISGYIHYPDNKNYYYPIKSYSAPTKSA